MAIGKGKNRLKTGNISVPNPNPEKKVSPAPSKTVIEMMIYSIQRFFSKKHKNKRSFVRLRLISGSN